MGNSWPAPEGCPSQSLHLSSSSQHGPRANKDRVRVSDAVQRYSLLLCASEHPEHTACASEVPYHSISAFAENEPSVCCATCEWNSL